MRKIKKYCIHIFLSIVAVFGLAFGTALWNNERVSVSAASTFTATETSVSVRRYADKRVMLNITADSEFDTIEANTNYAVAKLGDLNTLDYVFVNGKSMRELGVSSFFINLYGEAAFAFEGVQLSKYDVLTIKKGAQFPTKAYLTENAMTCYTASAESSWTHDETTWGIQHPLFAETETNVTSMEFANTHFGFYLSSCDYANAENNKATYTLQDLLNLNTLTNIKWNNVTLANAYNSGNVTFMQMWGRKALWIPITSAPVEGDTVTIPAGTQFPSYAFYRDSTETCYVIKQGVSFTYDGTNWTGKTIRTEEETSVTKIHLRDTNRLLFFLETNDYQKAGATTVSTTYAEYNTLDKIQIYVGNTCVTLKEALANSGDTNVYYNVWNETGSISYPLNAAAYTAKTVTKIVIPEGTEFPSVDGNVVYVTKKTQMFLNNSSASTDATDWMEQEESSATETSVTKIHLRDTNRLLFFLETNDYQKAGATTVSTTYAEYNTLDKIQIYVGNTCVTLKEALANSGDTNVYYNVWNETGSISYPLNAAAYTAKTVTKIVIPEGTEFPSYTGNVVYTTAEAQTFVNGTPNDSNAIDWVKPLVFNETATSVSEVKYNDTKESTNNVLYFWLTEGDYGTTEANVDISACVKNLNTYEYIEIDGKKVEDLHLGAQFLNFFTRWGAFGLQLQPPYSWDKGPSYVYVKAGCQIPSLAYAKDNGVLSVYVVENDLWIVYDDYHDVWNILTQKPENLVAQGEILPAYESVADRIFLGWELNGKLYKGGTTAPEAGTIHAVYLEYALENGASIRMADTADESGIRFTAYLQEASYTSCESYVQAVGMLVLPKELMGSEAFEIGHSAQPLNFYALAEKGYAFKDGAMTARATIHTIRATNYNRDYAARAYVSVKYADGTTDYAYGCFQAENHVRNVYEVATEAYKAGEGSSAQKDVLVGYANRIADLTFDGTTFALTTDTIGSAVSAIQTQSIEDGVVTLVTVAEVEPLLLVDGEPIRSERVLEKSFENNLFTVRFVYGTKSSLTYYASEMEMAIFLQDYFELYSMSGAYAVTHSGVASGWTYQQDWFMNGVAWFKATDFARNESSANDGATYSADGYAVYYFNNIDVDRNGNVYTYFNDTCPDTTDNGPNYSTVTSYTLMPGQGWTLPNSECDGWESYHAEFNDSGITDSALGAELETASNIDKAYENSTGWTVNGSAATQSNGVAFYTGTAKAGLSSANGATNAIVYEKTGISYSTYNAPFIELRLLIDDPNQAITDYAVEWQIGGAWYSVTQSEYANNPYTFPEASGMYRSYFPLYTHPNYGVGEVVYGNKENGKTVTGLRVVLIAKDSTSEVCVGLDYIRATADSRHSTNGAKYIVSLNEYAANHNDLDLLTQNITRARRAMLFLLEPLQGKNGLVNLSYLHRHDSYQGAANGFWDIYPAGHLNTDANIYFYEALLALADMEEALAREGISVTETASVEWYDLSGTLQTATYSHTAESLRTLAEKVKSNIRTTFYNSTTGRFAWSVYDVDSKGGNKAGTLMDYGFTELNLHAVEAGIATTEQANSIMSWIGGTRTVSGDKVTGGKIYEQPFAPVSTTKDNQKYISTVLQTGLKESDFTAFYIDKAFGERCQDGGTIMHVSYYDLLARAKTYGADNAYARLSEIKDWFQDVQAKNTNTTTDGWANFFANYYTKSGDLQGGSTQGKYGLQDEFKEAVMVMAAAPKIFLGLDAKYDTLTIAPNLGSILKYFGMENLAFGENTYTCYATASSVTISDVKKNANTALKVKLSLAYTAGQKVCLNGKLLDESAYTVENGYVIVTTDFANCTLQVKG